MNDYEGKYFHAYLSFFLTNQMRVITLFINTIDCNFARNKKRSILVLDIFENSMDYLPYFLKRFDLDLQPTNSICLDLQSAKTVLYPGAHVATSNPYEHYHHGIVIDTNTPEISIIHLWGPHKDTSRIQITTLPVFLAGSPEDVGKKTRQLYLVNYPDDTLEKQKRSMEIAKELLEKADEIVYDLASLNCESFSIYCRTGKWNSEQVDRIKQVLIANAMEIYEQIRNADEQNKKNIAAIVQAIPTDALSPEEKLLYHQLCERYLKEFQQE